MCSLYITLHIMFVQIAASRYLFNIVFFLWMLSLFFLMLTQLSGYLTNSALFLHRARNLHSILIFILSDFYANSCQLLTPILFLRSCDLNKGYLKSENYSGWSALAYLSNFFSFPFNSLINFYFPFNIWIVLFEHNLFYNVNFKSAWGAI